MATTTNFNWSTPDDTSLVKDGASAIRTLGSSIDSSFADLKGGTTGQVLSKASNTDLDYTWATSTEGSMTVLASGNLATGTTTTSFTGISSSYLNLRLVIRGFNGSGNNTLLMRVNNDSGGNYATYYSGYEANATRSQGSNGNTSWNLTAGPFTGGSYSNFMVYDFADYANTSTRKVVNCQAAFYDANGPASAIINATGGYSGTNAAISRIDLVYGSNVNGGTYILYGVK